MFLGYFGNYIAKKCPSELRGGGRSPAPEVGVYNVFLEVWVYGEDPLAGLPVAALVHVEAEQQVHSLRIKKSIKQCR